MFTKGSLLDHIPSQFSPFDTLSSFSKFHFNIIPFTPIPSILSLPNRFVSHACYIYTIVLFGEWYRFEGHHPISLRLILILSSCLCLGYPNGLVLSVFQQKLCTHITSSMRAMFSVHFVLLHLIIPT